MSPLAAPVTLIVSEIQFREPTFEPALPTVPVADKCLLIGVTLPITSPTLKLFMSPKVSSDLCSCSISSPSFTYLKIEDDVEEIFERKVTPYGNGAKVDAQKRYIGRKAFVIVLKK